MRESRDGVGGGPTRTVPVAGCVQVAVAELAVCVRDSKDLTRPHFSVGRDGWTSFVRYAAHG
ncbi:DUF397 domain-containing protein [Streptomyces sp. GQFP]|uniref:DUF397 domain-containing protein n=1 Tax=Streptomyces sp. GQFP TaxID=2907545 RepID=UPI001F3DCC98|nr:DUF397 domain-containing protein [Streptomyces sp. GQFP]UIX35296.1 DUF397 domain-containing protein [Streptomyces sp. GQFP]